MSQSVWSELLLVMILLHHLLHVVVNNATVCLRVIELKAWKSADKSAHSKRFAKFSQLNSAPTGL